MTARGRSAPPASTRSENSDATNPDLLDAASETVFDPALAGRSSDVLVGTVLRNRFVLEDVIGRGGMGVVYRARDLRREEAGDRKNFIAIKVLGQHLKHQSDAMVALQREARRAQQLAHPNIATVHDFDREGDIAYLCMELLTGRGMNEVLRDSASRGLALDDAMPIIQGMAQGLAYAHERGIVHADFKPGNVFLNDEGIVKVLDFGIARTMPTPGQTTNTGFDAGRLGALTPAYASCEMFQKQDPDPRDDIYGLACVTYELLAGGHPFRRLAANQARDAGLVPKPIAGLTRRQNQALQHGLEFERAKRTASAAAFLHELTPRRTVYRPAVSLAVVGVLSLVGAAAIALWLSLGAELSARPVSTLVEAPDLEVKEVAVPTRAPDPVDRATQDKIDRILQVADLHLAMGRAVTPEGSNAAEAYAAVAGLQPGNRFAIDGLAAVAVRLEEQSRDLAREGKRNEALSIVRTGLEWFPEHAGLTRLHEELLR